MQVGGPETLNHRNTRLTYAPLMLSSATLIASLNDLLNVGKDRTAVLGRSGYGEFGPQPIASDPNDRLLSSKTEEQTRKEGSCIGSLPTGGWFFCDHWSIQTETGATHEVSLDR